MVNEGFGNMRCKFFAVMATISATVAILYLASSWNNRPLPTQRLDEAGSRPQSPAALLTERRRVMSRFTHKVVNGIEKVLVFMGYPHSGHSILAAMLDAHPSIVLSTDYHLLSHWEKIKTRVKGDKYELFSEIVLSSLKASQKQKPGLQKRKGYSLVIPTQWQGNFSQLKIIGDKSAGKYAQHYSEEWSAEAEQTFNDIEQVLKIPVVIIHLVRNPFDMIATHTVLHQNKSLLAKHRWDHNVTRLKPTTENLAKLVHVFHNLSRGVLAIQRDWDSKFRMLETHHADFVYNPKKILRQICDFLDVDCREDYLEACDSVAFKTLSKSRYLLDWPLEIVDSVNNLIHEFPFFKRYSFDSD